MCVHAPVCVCYPTQFPWGTLSLYSPFSPLILRSGAQYLGIHLNEVQEDNILTLQPDGFV